MGQKIVPELYVSDFARSLGFYTEVIGFRIKYDRTEECFAYLDLDGAELMIEQPSTPERTFVAAEPAYPYGRGMNLSIEVPNVDAVYDRVQEAGSRVLLPLEVRWYRRNAEESGSRQFVVLDPDGYLLRMMQDVGTRELP